MRRSCPLSVRWRLVLIAAAAVTLDPGLAFAQESCTARCHASLIQGKNLHAAAESCDTCHETVDTSHPQAGRKTFKLSQEPPQLCFGCHDELGKKSDVHPPVQEGLCTTCHDPHSSDEPKLLSQPLSELCVTCHSDHVEFKVVHAPVSSGDCTVCHAAHESDEKPLLLQPADDLCFSCHADVQALLTKKEVHAAVSGGCTSCHNPHGSEHPKLLADAGAQICVQCHDQIGETVDKSPIVHPPVQSEKGCASCHSPHASDFSNLLPSTEKDSCIGCHPTVLTKAMSTLHGPINDGSCTACHAPHGAQFPNLLVEEFPAAPYAPYTDQEYGLCFGCHDRELVGAPDTSSATDFRNGETNLHFLHVNNSQKGRSCKLCHDVHGSSSPKLIAAGVPFGKWTLPLKFVKTDSGGSCAPGCHRPQVYDREKPVRKP